MHNIDFKYSPVADIQKLAQLADELYKKASNGLMKQRDDHILKVLTEYGVDPVRDKDRLEIIIPAHDPDKRILFLDCNPIYKWYDRFDIKFTTTDLGETKVIVTYG